jgi:hypothetical protein
VNIDEARPNPGPVTVNGLAADLDPGAYLCNQPVLNRNIGATV